MWIVSSQGNSAPTTLPHTTITHEPAHRLLSVHRSLSGFLETEEQLLQRAGSAAPERTATIRSAPVRSIFEPLWHLTIHPPVTERKVRQQYFGAVISLAGEVVLWFASTFGSCRYLSRLPSRPPSRINPNDPLETGPLYRRARLFIKDRRLTNRSSIHQSDERPHLLAHLVSFATAISAGPAVNAGIKDSLFLFARHTERTRKNVHPVHTYLHVRPLDRVDGSLCQLPIDERKMCHIQREGSRSRVRM